MSVRLTSPAGPGDRSGYDGRRPRTARAGADQDVARRRRLAAAGARTRRLTRTILLGSVVVFLAIVWLARELELDRDELLGYLATSLLLVGGIMALAVVAGGLLWLVRRLFSR